MLTGRFLVLASSIVLSAAGASLLTAPGTEALRGGPRPGAKRGSTSPPTAGKKFLPGQTVTNSIGMKLAYIPPGEFLMGSPATEKGRNDDERQGRVAITRPFFMGVYEVTQGEYEGVMGENPSRWNAKLPGREKLKGLDTSNFPVERVLKDKAVEFCKKLSRLPKEKAAGRAYRLPTEAEWEYACRAGTKTPFHFGTSLSSRDANFDGNYPYGAAAKGRYLERPTTVGSYKPNAWGLYDMHGNVAEYCSDWYKRDYERPLKDPRGPLEEEVTFRVNVWRGGSYWRPGAELRSAARVGRNGPYDHVGFRVVMTTERP